MTLLYSTPEKIKSSPSAPRLFVGVDGLLRLVDPRLGIRLAGPAAAALYGMPGLRVVGFREEDRNNG